MTFLNTNTQQSISDIINNYELGKYSFLNKNNILVYVEKERTSRQQNMFQLLVNYYKSEEEMNNDIIETYEDYTDIFETDLFTVENIAKYIDEIL